MSLRARDKAIGALAPSTASWLAKRASRRSSVKVRADTDCPRNRT